MKKFLISFLLFLFTISDSVSQSGWILQSSGTSNHLNKVFFINSSTGWISGDSGIILNTINGGINWNRQITNTSKNLLAVSFKDKDTGWATGGIGDNNPLCQDLVLILKTTNGGVNWFYNQSGYGNTYQDIAVTDNCVYVCSFGLDYSCMSVSGSILKTTNSGAVWDFLNVQIPSGFKSISFLNSNTGWAAGFWSTDVPPVIFSIFKTTNAGLNWQITFADSTPTFGDYYFSPCRKILFTDEYTGYAATRSSIGFAIIKSTDGGYTWLSLDSNISSSIISLEFLNSNTGWAAGYSGKIIRTDNGGLNWSVQQSNVNNYFNSLDFINEDTGWVVGNYGVILKTITGGITSVTNISYDVPKGFTLNQNYPNPFNPKTTITYELPYTQHVLFKVFDIAGKEIITLINQSQNSGTYEVSFDTGSEIFSQNGGDKYGLSSGIYFYTLQTENYFMTKRMIFLK